MVPWASQPYGVTPEDVKEAWLVIKRQRYFVSRRTYRNRQVPGARACSDVFIDPSCFSAASGSLDVSYRADTIGTTTSSTFCQHDLLTHSCYAKQRKCYASCFMPNIFPARAIKGGWIDNELRSHDDVVLLWVLSTACNST